MRCLRGGSCYDRSAAELVALDESLPVPIRDAADAAIVRTAIAGEADLICTADSDFYDATITQFLSSVGVRVLKDIAVMQMLRATTREADAGPGQMKAN